MSNQNKRVLEAKINWKCKDHKGNETVKQILWNPNTHCRTFLSENISPDTADWVGKVLILETYEKNVGGQLRDIIKVIDIMNDNKKTIEQPKLRPMSPAPVKEIRPMAEDLICKECKKPIAEVVYNFSMSRYHAPLCRECQIKYAPTLNKAKAVKEEEPKNKVNINEEDISNE
jgi:hypothetical protein